MLVVEDRLLTAGVAGGLLAYCPSLPLALAGDELPFFDWYLHSSSRHGNEHCMGEDETKKSLPTPHGCAEILAEYAN